MEDHRAGPQADDVLDTASEDLERAETQDDEARLAALESLHARLSGELDGPAGDAPAG